VGGFIAEALEKRASAADIVNLRRRVEDFARAFPLFAW
jgi:hypothetical protein